MRSVLTTARAGIFAVAVLASACGSSSNDADSNGDRLNVVVTTTILGDVVSEAFGAAVDVETIMPPGADPHDFAPSARQAESMEEADLLVISGAGFEAGMTDVIDAAAGSGTPLFVASDSVQLLPVAAGDDPHFWTDPVQMIAVVDALEARLVSLTVDDAAEVQSGAESYRGALRAVDAEIAVALASVPETQRVLVTNHEVFSYFAKRYGYEVIGAIIPSWTTGAEPSAANLDELARLIEDAAVPAIFGETSRSTDLAEALADDVDVDVVELFSESLGEAGSGADTYVSMLRTNADLVANALGGNT